jgi:plastocyanin domain-containing protein
LGQEADMRPLNRAALLAACALTVGSAPAQSPEPEFSLVIEQHRFTPAELVVPAGRKVRLVIENRDPTPEEFESYSLNREKIVPGHGCIVVFVGPLEPGTYEFFGEFNMATARGQLIAR